MQGIWWLASYPKSGNTWLRALIATLVSGRPADINNLIFLGEISSSRFGFDDALGIAAADLSLEQQTNMQPRAYEIWAAEAPRPLYCKAHDCYHLTPAGEPLFPTAATRGAVYVVRDPRAVAVSLAHHTGRTIDDEIARMNNAEAAFSAAPERLDQQLHQRLRRWSDHVTSWLAAPFAVHLVRYEDMHRDPHAAFGAVAAFLGLPCDRETIAAAVAATTFACLQAQERASGFKERPRQARVFFREGRIDGWRAALTPEQAARIVADHGAAMNELGYDVGLGPLCAGVDSPSIGNDRGCSAHLSEAG
jgi:aryl sulfotransferase